MPGGCTRAEHPPDGHGLGHALEGRGAQVFEHKGLAHQPRRHRADHHGVRCGQAFQAGRNVGRFAQGQLLVPAPATDVSDDHRSRVDAKPDGELHAVAGLQTRIQPPDGLDEFHARVHRPLRIVFMRLWVAKVDEQPIPEVLRNMPLVALNHHGRSLLIGPHNGPEVFRVKLPREHRRAHQVAEQHGQLPPFGLVGTADRLRCGPGDVR